MEQFGTKLQDHLYSCQSSAREAGFKLKSLGCLLAGVQQGTLSGDDLGGLGMILEEMASGLDRLANDLDRVTLDRVAHQES